MGDMKLLFRNVGREIGQAIGESIVETLRAEMPRIQAELTGGPVPPRRSSTRGERVSQALLRPCPVPGCEKQGRGPRFSFLCEVHRDLPAAEREKYRVRPKA